MDSSSCAIGSYFPPKLFYILAVLSLSLSSLSSSAHTTSVEGMRNKKESAYNYGTNVDWYF